MVRVRSAIRLAVHRSATHIAIKVRIREVIIAILPRTAVLATRYSRFVVWTLAVSAWGVTSVTAANQEKIRRITTGGVLAALAWVLFLLATYSPLSNLAVQVVIGGIVAYYYLLFGLKWGLLLALTIGILTVLQPGLPLNLALILYFMPWPLIKGSLESRIFLGGETIVGEERDDKEEKRRSLACWILKWLAATALFGLGYVILQTIFMGTMDGLRASFNAWFTPWLGDLADVARILLAYFTFLVFTVLYEQVLILVIRRLGRH